MAVSAQWSNESAFNLELGQQEAQSWIEAVTGEKFKGNFQQSLKDGKLLCKLINQIKPGSVKKINSQNTGYAEMENISFYLNGAKNLGLKETQLFTSKELYEENGRIRDVVISLYWLGRAARGVPTYKGPHLNLSAFQKMKCTKCRKDITDNNYLATMDQQWHKQCATCCSCNCALDPSQPFYQNGNDIYCHNCMVKASNVGSGNTKSPHSHGHGHGSKHNCGKCHKNLEGESHAHGPDGQDYCLGCICDLCHNPLDDSKTVKKGGKKYCTDCTCSDCKDPFTEEGFFEKNGKNVCPKCVNKAAPASNTGKGNNTNSGGNNTGNNSNLGKKPIGTGNSVGNSPKSTSNSNSDDCKACHTPLNGNSKKHHHPGKTSEEYCDKCEPDYCCDTCHEEINGPAVSALNRKYHPTCFNCNNCGVNLQNKGGFKENNKRPYCLPCYDKSTGKFGFCAGCGKGLDRNGIQALDMNWHPECFVCATCRKSFPNGEFIEYENMPYCQGCAPAADVCVACKKALSGQVTNVLGKMWHQGCFKCTKCKGALITGYTPYDGFPYCEPCYLSMNGDKCQLCNQVIVGKAVKAKGKEWHSACFKCTTCGKALTGTTENPDVFIKFSKPYCRTCNPPSLAPASPNAPATTVQVYPSTSKSPASSPGGKFCSGCGKPASGSKFCSSCGTKLA